MSINVSISGEIIESQNYLSNYFVTLTGDQTISGNKLFTNVTTITNVSNINFIDGKLNASTLDISTNLLTFNGNSGVSGQVLTTNGSYPVWSNSQTQTLFGSQDISDSIYSGNISFDFTFTEPPCVTITQVNVSRIVPICITNISNTFFQWKSTSKGVGKIMWSAGLKS